MSQSSISRAITEVNVLITRHLMPIYIKFPITPEAKTDRCESFSICLYKSEGPVFYQIILCFDSNCKILAVDSRFPESVHNVAIFQMSDLGQLLYSEYENGDISLHGSYVALIDRTLRTFNSCDTI